MKTHVSINLKTMGWMNKVAKKAARTNCRNKKAEEIIIIFVSIIAKEKNI